jgi:hypothetical protein
MRFSANLGFLWTELELPEAIRAAAAAGFDAVECHWPYATDPAELREALAEAGLPMVALNTRPGDRARGEFGLAALARARGGGACRNRGGRGLCQRGRRRGGARDGRRGGGGRRQNVSSWRTSALPARGWGADGADRADQPCGRAGVFPWLGGSRAGCARQGRGAEPEAHGGLLPPCADGASRGRGGRSPDASHGTCADRRASGTRRAGYRDAGLRMGLRRAFAVGMDGVVGAEYRPDGPTENSLGWLETWRGD